MDVLYEVNAWVINGDYKWHPRKLDCTHDNHPSYIFIKGVHFPHAVEKSDRWKHKVLSYTICVFECTVPLFMSNTTQLEVKHSGLLTVSGEIDSVS